MAGDATINALTLTPSLEADAWQRHCETMGTQPTLGTYIDALLAEVDRLRAVLSDQTAKGWDTTVQRLARLRP